MIRRLIVNADDFGFTRDVNAGIVEAHRKGILTATTLMANGAAFDDAVRLAKQTPSLDVGCHLVLVGGASLVTGAEYPDSVASLIRAVLSRRIDPRAELRAQVERILAAGLQPLHLDTHKHTHLFPPVLTAVARLSEEFRIPWIRRPFDFPLRPGGAPLTKRIVARAFRAVGGGFEKALRERRCRMTDHFAGFAITGRYGAGDVAALIGSLPEGLTEFMTHPGFCTDELRSARTRLKESRQAELDALIAPEARDALRACGVTLASYKELR